MTFTDFFKKFIITKLRQSVTISKYHFLREHTCNECYNVESPSKFCLNIKATKIGSNLSERSNPII